MKKGFVLFLSIIFIAFTGFMPVKADNDITIGGSSYIDDYITRDDYKRINYSGLLAEYLRQGGTVDIGNMDTNSEDLASDIINSFGDFAVDVLRKTGNFIDWIGNDQVFQEELVVNRDPVAWKPALRQNVWQLMGQLPFMYLNTDDGELPVPVPNPDYATYVNIINGTSGDGLDFFWRDYTYQPSSNVNSLPASQSNYSFVLAQLYMKQNSSDNFRIVTSQYNANYSFFYSTPISLYFNTTSNGQVILSFTCDTNIPQNRTPNDSYYYIASANGINITNSQSYMFNSYTYNNTYKITNYSKTFLDLASAFTYATQIVRNVNIYVDGVAWSTPHNIVTPTYNIELGTGTVVPTTNGRVEWKYDDEIYIDIDLIWQLLDRFINDPNRTTTIIDFGVLKDCIVDANGQTAIAVKVIEDDPLSIDDQLVLDYGTLIPVFPVAVDYPIDVRDTARIAVIGVQVLPSDIIEIVILGIFGMLFVCFVHRGLE